MGNTTDALIEHFLKACENRRALRELDDVASMGERISARIFTAAIKACGVDAKYFDPLDANWPIITDEEFGNANPILKECIPRIKRTVLPLLEKGIIPVIPGFIGKTLKGEITTLGRGGSDVTAFVLARSIEADEVLLVTDVNGVMAADPKIVANPKLIKIIDVRKLLDICDSGAKFIHRKALKLSDGSFKIKIIGNKGFDAEGTIVTGSFPKMPARLGHASPATMITFAAEAHDSLKILAEISKISNRYKIQILAWCVHNNVICIYIPEIRINEMAKIFYLQIAKNGYKILMSLRKSLALLKVLGVESNNAGKILKKIIELFEEKGITVAGVHTAASEILVFVDWKEKDTALSLLKHVCRVYNEVT